MCGIAGIIEHASSPTGVELIDLPVDRLCHTMLSCMQHRGPDEAGLVAHRNSALGNVRLSIIDLSNGAQPISNHDGSIWIVYNGEIYDSAELRASLQKRGCVFKTQTDTEVILYLYQEFGEECYHHLNGEFAFAIMDLREGSPTFVLARDLWGIRPLNYAITNRGIVFCSEIKPILSVSAGSVNLDQTSFLETVTSWVACPPRTAFAGIHTLCPGEMMIVADGAIRRRSMLNSVLPEVCLTTTKPDPQHVRHLIEKSVQRRLVADVPVGVYVSGGLDSSIVSLLAAKNYPGTLDSYSIAFDDARFDESEYQYAMSEYLGTNHRQLRISSRDLVENFIPATQAAESFVFRSAYVPMFLLSKLVRDSGGKVVLTGEGSDEFFSGYDIFRELYILRALGAETPDIAKLSLLAADLYQYIPEYATLDKRLLLGYYSKIRSTESNIPLAHRQRWLTFNKVRNYFDVSWDIEGVARSYRNVVTDLERYSVGNAGRLIEAVSLLHGYLLSVQGDRMALAHSVETRLPFLDRELVRYLLSIEPMDLLKVEEGRIREKYLLNEIFMSDLPAVIQSRRKNPYLAPDMVAYGSLFREMIGDAKKKLLEQLPFLKIDMVQNTILSKEPEKVNRIENTLLFCIASAAVLVDLPHSRNSVSLIPLVKNIRV